MPTTRLSSKGQIVIPKAIRDAHRWKAGQELEVIDTDEGIILRARSPFPRTTIDAAYGCLDFADALHLAHSEGQGPFVTFDTGVEHRIQQVGTVAPDRQRLVAHLETIRM